MNTFKEYLEEGRDAPLYHATNSPFAILNDNEIRGQTYHLKKNLTQKKMKNVRSIYNSSSEQLEDAVNGVSLTRSFKFAKTWGDVVFELDQRLLSQRYKIVPYNYFSAFSSKPSMLRTEAEEFLLGNIHPLNKYLTKIYFSWDLSKEKAQHIIDKWKVPYEQF